jgi:hypothetical protein
MEIAKYQQSLATTQGKLERLLKNSQSVDNSIPSTSQNTPAKASLFTNSGNIQKKLFDNSEAKDRDKIDLCSQVI